MASKCILCLETQTNVETFIKVFSEEGESLCVKNIIIQHFWIKPHEDESLQCICRSCWSSLREFHEFYARIEEAHKCLQQQTIEELSNSIYDPIYCETRMKTRNKRELKRAGTPKQNVDAPNIKRKRGRPKSVKNFNVLEETPIDTDSVMPVERQFNDEDPEMDILSAESTPAIDPCSPINCVLQCDSIGEIQEPPKKKRRGRPSLSSKKTDKTRTYNKKSKSSSNKSDGLRIKAELEFDEFIDAQFDTQLAAAVDEAHHPEMEHSEVNMKKNYSERRDLSLKFDEFIAQNMKLSCCLCESPLKDFSQLKSHFREQHKIRGYVLCCGKKLPKRGVLVDHLHTHLDAEYFKCRECNKVMADRRCLETHMKIHEDKGKPAFQCEVCSKSYHRKVVYMRHMQNHMPEDMKKHECPECSKKFATHYLMNQHLHIVHLNTYSKICDICGKKIHGRDALQRHQRQHGTEPPPPIQCELCGLTLTTKYGLNRHMKSKHIADYQKPQVCPYCSKVSPSYFAQKRHIYYMHNIERRHACPMCEKAFKRSKDLKEHMTTHTGDVLYSCSYCPKTFNSDANMYSHRKKVHRKEWEQKMKEKFPLVNMKEQTNNAESEQPSMN